MRYTGYCRRQTGSISSDLFEIGCAFAIALLLGYAMIGFIS